MDWKKINVIKMSILFKVINMFSVIPTKSPMAFVIEIENSVELKKATNKQTNL